MKRIHFEAPEYIYNLLERECKKRKKTKSDYMRDLITKRAGNKKLAQIEEIIVMNSQILLDISRVTGNLNQIAYHLNAGNFISDDTKFYETSGELKVLVKEAIQLIKNNNLILRKIV